MKTLCVAVLSALCLLASVPAGSLPMQDPLQHPLLAIDEPYQGGMVGRDFVIRGTALNSDYVHIWALPSSGGVFLGGVTTSQPDATRQLAGGSFSLWVHNAPIGTYPIVVYAHEAATGTFPTWVSLPMDVRACVTYTASWPFQGAYGPTTVAMPFCAAQ